MTDPNLNADGSPVPYPGEFLRVIIGSTVHGLHVKGTDDLDLIGICIESAEEAIGLGKPFEQHTWRTQPEGHPSGPGDVDLSTYSLKKFLRLASNGNPTVLNVLFVGPESRHVDSELGDELRALTPQIVSREAAPRYRGYLQAQRERLLGIRGQKHTGRARRQQYMVDPGSGDRYDAKFAMHMVRLGCQGVELLTTGRISLPMQEPIRSRVLDIRLGKVPLDTCIEWTEHLDAELEDLAKTADLPDHPDRVALNKWLTRTYLDAWASGGRSVR